MGEAKSQPISEHEQMLYTTVLVRVSSSTGSGTVIYSQQRDDRWHSYVLTNRHVVGDAIIIKEEWDARLQKDVKRERREQVNLSWFVYNKFSRASGTNGRKGVIVAHDKAADLALLKVTDEERSVPYVAALQPEDADIYLAEPVWTVGAGLGRPPFITDGMLALLDEQIESYRYILSTAPVIFGNSGGGLFHFSEERKRYELIGVPSKASGAAFTIVSHMAWSIPIETVREFLRASCYGFITGDEVEDPDKCDGPGEITSGKAEDR